jgi:hypothetical protein
MHSKGADGESKHGGDVEEAYARSAQHHECREQHGPRDATYEPALSSQRKQRYRGNEYGGNQHNDG